MIEIIGNSEKVYSEIWDEVEVALIAEAAGNNTAFDNDDTERIADWAWKHYASLEGAPGREYARFETSYDTWDDLVESYREDAYNRYAESLIG